MSECVCVPGWRLGITCYTPHNLSGGRGATLRRDAGQGPSASRERSYAWMCSSSACVRFGEARGMRRVTCVGICGHVTTDM